MTIKILVGVKRVADPNVQVRVRSDGSAMDLANVRTSINPFDEVAVEEDALREQPVAGAQRMQQHDIVRRLADGVVQVDIGLQLGLEGALRMGRAHRLHDARQRLPVVVRRPAGGEVRRDALQLAAIFDVIFRRALVAGDEVDHGAGEDLADDIGDIGAVAMLADEQPPVLQLLQRLAQDRAGNIEALGKLALARQLVAVAQHPFKQQKLDLPHDLVRGPAMADAGEKVEVGVAHAADTTQAGGNWSTILSSPRLSACVNAPYRRMPDIC